MVSNLQLGSPELLTTHEPSLEDRLSEMARDRRTKVIKIGDQAQLFSTAVTPMVEVILGKTSLTVPAEMAARFGLFPE